jgi:cellulose synthase operon protein B
MKPLFNQSASSRSKNRQRRSFQKISLWLLLCCSGVILGLATHVVPGQDHAGIAIAQSSNGTVKRQEDQLIQQFDLPKAPPQAPVYQPAPAPAPAPAPIPDSQPVPDVPASSGSPAPAASQPAPKPSENKPATASAKTASYSMKFNRDPIVGNRLRLQGPYAEAGLDFTRPRHWKVQSAKALIRFQHSPALLAGRSNLTIRVNGTSVGSVVLNRKESQVGQVLVNIPPSLIQDFNNITMVAQQNNSPECSDPADQTLWTEILPDSEIVFNYIPQPIALDFSRYPYPIFDPLNLDATQIAYLTPKQMSGSWLTAAARLQASIGRLADFRPVETRMVQQFNQLRWNDRLVVVGTPEEQPLLKSLKLPYGISNNQILDGGRNPLPADVGVLVLTTAPNSGVPVLVATGNSAEGVTKAVQSLVQPQNRQLNTGQAVLVTDLQDIPSPNAREWSRYIPTANSFKLSDLKGQNNQPFEDTTVRGAYAPPIEFDFRALPDDQFQRGNTMTLHYSYGPQVNPRLSTVEVRLDGTPIGANRLTSVDGENNKKLDVNLPENLIKPNSKIQVLFNLSPREPGECGRVSDQQLWGKVHADTQFKLNRISSVQLPNLKLLQNGYPFAAPQDLSEMAIVLPDSPTRADVATLLEFSERMGRVSQANSIKLDVYTTGTLPNEARSQKHLVGIGTRDKFPFPEAFESGGFSLKNLFTRQSNQGQVQALPDNEGVIQSVMSPWNGNRVLLALSGQSESGLDKVRDLFSKDTLFFQLKGDTVLINTSEKNPSAYDPNAYDLEFIERSQTRRIEQAGLLNKSSRFLQDNWFLLPTGIVVTALVLFGIVQLYLKRVATAGGVK